MYPPERRPFKSIASVAAMAVTTGVLLWCGLVSAIAQTGQTQQGANVNRNSGRTQPVFGLPQASNANTNKAGSSTATPQDEQNSLRRWLQEDWVITLIPALLLLALILLLIIRARTRPAKVVNKSRPKLVRPPARSASPPRVAALSAGAGSSFADLDAGNTHAIENSSPTNALPEVTVLNNDDIMKTPSPFDRVNSEVENILSGREYDLMVVNSSDPATRLAVSQALLTVLTPRKENQHEAAARRAFMENGYFDELTQELRTAVSAEQRANAAEKLGIVCEPVSTAHLIAALHDSSALVRRSAVEALAQLGLPQAIPALNELLHRETDPEVPEAFIRECINAIAMGESTSEAVTIAEKPMLRVVEKPQARPEDEAFTEFLDMLKKREAPTLLPAAKQLVGVDSGVSDEEARLREEEEALRQAVAELEEKRRAAEAARRKAEEEARLKAEMEAQARAEIEAQIRAEEEARRRAAEEAARRQVEDEARIKAEQEARLQAEEEAQRRAEDEARFRLEAETLRQAAEELAQKRAAAEQARRLAEEEARLRFEEQVRQQQEEEERLRAEEEARLQAEEEERLRAAEKEKRRAEKERELREAEERLRTEEDRLLAEQGALLEAASELARRRVEIEEARRKTEEEARALDTVEQRIRQEEEEHQRIDEERRQVEAEARQRAEEVRQRLEEARRRAESEQNQLEELARIQAEEQNRRLQELEAIRMRAAEEARLRTEQENRLREEIEVLQKAEQEQRERIEAETRRREEMEARIREEEARLEAEEQERLRNEEQARAREDEHARLRAEAEAEAAADAETRRRAEEEARLMAEEEARIWAEEETQRRAEAETRALAETETHLRLERELQQPSEPASSNQGLPAENASEIPTELLNRLKSEVAGQRAAALLEVVGIGGDNGFRFITEAFDDQSPEVRNAAARALYAFQPDRAASFTIALRQGSQERRRRIGAALAESGLARDAISNLMNENRETTYDAFSLLFLMAKAGEVDPLMRAIEDHLDVEARLAVVKLLALSGQPEIIPAFRRLAVRGSLPSEVRSAVMEAIYQISSQTRQTTPSAA